VVITLQQKQRDRVIQERSIGTEGGSALEVCMENDLVCIAMETTKVQGLLYVFLQFIGHKNVETFKEDLYSSDSLYQFTSNNNFFDWYK
jgi:hypothetical protein